MSPRVSLLQSTTAGDWFARGVADLGGLLSDHLHCERKAAENALSLIRRYPHDPDFVDALSRLAHEETSHVIQVSRLIAERGMHPRADTANTYARQLLAEVRPREPERRVDLLLVAGFIEARSHERLCLLATGFAHRGDTDLADIYATLAHAEDRHAEIYVDLALQAASHARVNERILALGRREAEILASLPLASRIH